MTTNPFNNGADLDHMGDPYLFIGYINRFNNSFQTIADQLFDGVSWKQVFFLNCIALFSEPPTIKDMAGFVGCSHQNAKQILIKLEKLEFVAVSQDPADKRKQRISLTDKAVAFREKYTEVSDQAMRRLFEDVAPQDLKTTIHTVSQLDAKLKDFPEARI